MLNGVSLYQPRVEVEVTWCPQPVHQRDPRASSAPQIVATKQVSTHSRFFSFVGSYTVVERRWFYDARCVRDLLWS
jgi:hypothetical protein